jgi:hypothetical protein
MFTKMYTRKQIVYSMCTKMCTCIQNSTHIDLTTCVHIRFDVCNNVYKSDYLKCYL